MPSFQITISPKRLAAARYVTLVRRELQRALAAEAQAGLTQAEVARRLEVNRSVVNRQLQGTMDITGGGAAELAWAMGYTPVFRLEKAPAADGLNVRAGADQRAKKTPGNLGWVKEVQFMEMADAG